MPHFDNIADFWEYYTYPWRPDSVFKYYIPLTQTGNEHICILWATQELRKWCDKKEVTVCDLSQKMLKAGDVGNKNENILCQDWFCLDWGEYDIILGDIILLLFPYKKQIELINILLQNMSPSGKIILRIVVKNQTNDSLSALDKIQKIKNIYNGSTSESDFFNRLSFECVNGFDWKAKDIYEILQQMAPRSANAYKQNFYNLTPYNSSQNYTMSTENFESFVENFNVNLLYSQPMNFVTEYIIEIQNEKNM